MIDFTTQARPLHFMYITCAAILSHLLHIYSMCVWVQSCFIIYCCDTFPWIPLRLSGWSVSSLCAISSKNQQLLNCWGQMVVEVSLLCVHNQWPETVLKLEKKKKNFSEVFEVTLVSLCTTAPHRSCSQDLNMAIISVHSSNQASCGSMFPRDRAIRMNVSVNLLFACICCPLMDWWTTDSVFRRHRDRIK